MAVSGRLFKRILRVAAAVRLRRWAARTVSAVCPEVIYVTTAIASRRAACAVAVVFVHFATTTAGIFVGRLVQYVRIACRAAGVWVALSIMDRRASFRQTSTAGSARRANAANFLRAVTSTHFGGLARRALGKTKRVKVCSIKRISRLRVAFIDARHAIPFQ